MDILSPLLKPKIFNIRGKFLLGLITIRSDIQINLNSYNTFTGNLILSVHAVPGCGIATFSVAANETRWINLEHITKLVVKCTSRKNINYERDYYLPPSTPSTTEQVTNARAKKIFILKYRIGRLFSRTVCKSRMI